MRIIPISFEKITPFWMELWPGLKIEERSGRLLSNIFDKNIMDDETIQVSYFGAEVDGKIVGVNSGFSPKSFEYRSRGLYVLPEYRRMGISQELFKAVENKGKEEEKIIMWSMPRSTALNAYLKFGFKVISKFYKHEYGLNCFVIKGIKGR